MNRKLLVVYATRYGQTEKIARRIGEVARQQGLEADVVAVADVTEAALAAPSDVVVAGAIYFGRHDRSLTNFVRRMLPLLGKRHTAFVSICNSAGDREVSEKFVRKFLARTAWKPDTTAIFAGATAYTRYGPLIRFLMRRIALSQGGSGDTSRDHEHTDWTAVETFARNFVSEAQARVA